jgi:T5SS/PEP-CTERM-associated repeat protein
VPAHAQTFWSGTTSSDWFTGSNWVGGTIPTTAADAILDTIVPNPTAVNAPGALALDLVVGGLGTGALTIGSGGTVSNHVGHVGGCSGCPTTTFGTVIVSGAGATWTNTAGLAVGDSSTGQVTVANGGRVLTGSTGGFIGVRPGAVGTMTVTDPGSSWNITDQLVVAGFVGPASGALFVQNGGAVTSTAGTIGFSSGSTGARSPAQALHGQLRATSLWDLPARAHSLLQAAVP